MAIPDFFRQQQQSFHTGLGLGNAMEQAQQNAMFAPAKQELMQSKIAGQGIQNRLGQARIANVEQKTESEKKENFKKGLSQDIGMLAVYSDDDELFDKVLNQMAAKYENDPIISPLMDDFKKEKNHEKRNTALFTLMGVLNPDKSKGRSTTAIENQKHYDKLKKTDPEGAELFAASAKLTTGKDGGKKRIFKVIENDDGSLTKIFSDGTESKSSENEEIKTDDMKRSISMKQALNVLDKAKEASLKNGGFAVVMQGGLTELKELEAKNFKPKDIAMVQTYLARKSLGNYVMSADEQVYAGAIEKMINAIARRESGAAIGEEETQRFFGRYMPQAGDTEPRLKQKRRALETQFKSIRGQSGRVYDALRLTMGIDSQAPKEQSKSAPQSALDYLKLNPDVSEQFKMKYGYLPEGF